MKKILVIDDELQNLYLLLECLTSKGFYTIGAENGLLGIQQAKKKLPDLIICDILMPVLDGYGVLKALRHDPSTASIPLIFLTAKVDKVNMREGMELRADDYLTKPCGLNELMLAISAQLEKQSALQQGYATQSRTALEPPPTYFKKTTVTQSIFPSHPKLNQVFNFIEANYYRSITLSAVAQAVGYSPTYLTNLMGQETGNTLHCWIIKRRMAAACSLLLESKLTVNQIAQAVGYQDASYFSRQFHQLYGVPPNAWRKSRI